MMKSKPFEMCLLFDFYGEMLTEKQKELFDLYYNEDLSLTEISEHAGITRQGVRDAVSRAETTLRDMEYRLKLVARYGKIQSNISKIKESAEHIRIENNNKTRNLTIAEESDKILSLANLMLESE
ncbi:MAG: sigma factor-like helix-turn-helix DNA-binding protein [Bacillota bacterium]|nr:sigma factor-like helix-turn-helix DNA-binding protein [Bacillota bacterium]